MYTTHQVSLVNHVYYRDLLEWIVDIRDKPETKTHIDKTKDHTQTRAAGPCAKTE